MSLSSAFESALAAQDTIEGGIVLLTIAHADWSAPVRVAANTEDVESRGNTFAGFPFRIDFPRRHPTEIPDVTISIDNVTREISDALRTASSPPTFKAEIVSISEPDTVQFEVPLMKLRQANVDTLVVTGTLMFEPVLQAAFPAGRFTPVTHPGLFK